MKKKYSLILALFLCVSSYSQAGFFEFFNSNYSFKKAFSVLSGAWCFFGDRMPFVTWGGLEKMKKQGIAAGKERANDLEKKLMGYINPLETEIEKFKSRIQSLSDEIKKQNTFENDDSCKIMKQIDELKRDLENVNKQITSINVNTQEAINKYNTDKLNIEKKSQELEKTINLAKRELDKECDGVSNEIAKTNSNWKRKFNLFENERINEHNIFLQQSKKYFPAISYEDVD